MKFLYLSIVSLMFLGSCQNELYKDASKEFESKQGVYMVEKDAIHQFVQEGKDLEITAVKLGLVKKEESTVRVSLEAGSPEQLSAYNKANGTNYVMLPKEMYDFANEVVFEPEFTSATASIFLKNLTFSPEGTYALPVKIVGKGGESSGSHPAVIPDETETIIVLEQEINTKALRISGSGTEDKKMFPDNFKVDQWTMEIMVNRSAYSSNNKSICGTKTVDNSPVTDEIFTRFGDVTITPSQLQIKTGGSQIDIPKDKLDAKPKTWYMLSFVYDGKNTRAYIDGVLAAETEIRSGAYGMTGFWIGGSNELVREARFYKVARTAKQIADNVWKMVDYNDDNLLLYYPMNGKKYDHATGKIVEDETKVWDWSKNEKHLEKPANSTWDNNSGKGFVFPPKR